MDNDRNRTERLTRNTAFLYMRMFLLMGISLYTARVVLHVLGVEDFGIYNMIGIVVALFSFINASLLRSTQRFLSYELGKDGERHPGRVFGMALLAHMTIAAVILLLAETAGLWFLDIQLNIPAARVQAAHIAYQFVVVTTIVQIMQTPLGACIISHERMHFYAYMSIGEAVMKLGFIAALLLIPDMDRLVLYSVLLSISAVITFLVYFWYCVKCCNMRYEKMAWHKDTYRQILAFSGWNLFGIAANMGAVQGVSIFLNIFYGVILNAAVGIANQVTGAVYGFVSNFQTAFDPQIVKAYASGDKDYFYSLIVKTSKFSYFLLLLLALPFCLEAPYILKIWLTDVPDFSASFSILMLIYLLVDAIQAPLWIAVQATGHVRNYQLMVAVIILISIPFIYLSLKMGFPPEYVFGVRILFNIIAYSARLAYVKKTMNIPVKAYIVNSPCLAILVTLISLPVPLFIRHIASEGMPGFLVTCSSAVTCVAASIWYVGMNRSERLWLGNVITEKFRRKQER